MEKNKLTQEIKEIEEKVEETTVSEAHSLGKRVQAMGRKKLLARGAACLAVLAVAGSLAGSCCSSTARYGAYVHIPRGSDSQMLADNRDRWPHSHPP